MARAAFAMLAMCVLQLGCGSREPVCKAMYSNSCNTGCECPDGYTCRVTSDGDWDSKGQNRCYKHCGSVADCPSDHHCVRAEYALSGAGTRVEGRCSPACDTPGSTQGCPSATACQSIPVFPDTGESVAVCD